MNAFAISLALLAAAEKAAATDCWWCPRAAPAPTPAWSPPAQLLGDPVTCGDFQPRAHLKLGHCMEPGNAICRNDPNLHNNEWKFGIDNNDRYVKLWNPEGEVVFYAEPFPGTTELCIGEHGDDPWLTVTYDGGVAKLYCNGGYDDSVDALLKIVDVEDYDDDTIVKFRKGPGDDNALWTIDRKGNIDTDSGCTWYFPTTPVPPTPVPQTPKPTPKPPTPKPTPKPPTPKPTPVPPTPKPTPVPPTPKPTPVPPTPKPTPKPTGWWE